MGDWIKSLLAPELASGPPASFNGLRFGVPLSWPAVLLLLAGLVLLFGWFYARSLARLTPRVRRAVLALRCAALALLLFMLLDPTLVLRRMKPGEQYLLLLFDGSRSMNIEGSDGKSRAQRLTENYKKSIDAFEGTLGKTCRLARYRFGEGLVPIRSIDDLRFEDTDSDLIGALDQGARDLAGLDIAGAVLFSDGVQQTESRPAALPPDFAFPAPIHTVNAAAEAAPGDGARPWQDLELGRLGVQRMNFDGSPVQVTALARATGLAGEQAVAEVILDGRVAESSAFLIDSPEMEREIRFEFVPKKKDWLDYTVRVRLKSTGALPDGGVVEDISANGRDRILQNNTRHFLVDARELPRRILYLSGRPAWENKFVRRALEDDPSLRLTSLIRVSRADNKFVFHGKKSAGQANPLFEGFDGAQEPARYDESVFVRIGVQGSELDKGYPTLAEDLFPYDLVIWGDIERDFFSQAHLDLTREFVRKRGGTLLFLGGPASFTEGNYKGSVLEEMMPFILSPGPSGANDPHKSIAIHFTANPTVEGMLSGAWSLDPDPATNTRIWGTMPRLANLNRFDFTRPGAVVWSLATPSGEGGAGGTAPEPLFAVQRYGEGRCAVMATGATWPWRMELDEKDARHERFWRQITRALTGSVPGPVYLRGESDRHVLGRTAGFDAIVRDKLFDEREGLRLTATLTPPTGTATALPVDESIKETGVYRIEAQPTLPGIHKIALEALDEKGDAVARFDHAFLAEEDQREFQQARPDPKFLEDLSKKTGGIAATLADLPTLADQIQRRATIHTDEVLIHLWRFPGFFAALALLLSLEWYLRRRGGLA